MAGQHGDHRILIALKAADGALLVLQSGLGSGGRLVYLPHEGVARQILRAAVLIRAVLVGAPMPVVLRILIPRAAVVGMLMVSHIRPHGDLLVGLDIAAAAAIVILDRHIRLSLCKLVTIEDRIAGYREDSLAVVVVNRRDHHALRVELVAGHVLGLIRLLGDFDALHRLDDLRLAKAVDHPHIRSWRTAPRRVKVIRSHSVYGHLILCKLVVVAACNFVKIDLYPIFCIRLEGCTGCGHPVTLRVFFHKPGGAKSNRSLYRRRNLGICYICARPIPGHRDRQCGHICLARRFIGVACRECDALIVVGHFLFATFVVGVTGRCESDLMPYMLPDLLTPSGLLHDIFAGFDRYGACSFSGCSDVDSRRITIGIVSWRLSTCGFHDLECKGRAFRTDALRQSLHLHVDCQRTRFFTLFCMRRCGRQTQHHTKSQYHAEPLLFHGSFLLTNIYPLNAARAASARRIHSVRSP